jgi:5'-3' exonuclease
MRLHLVDGTFELYRAHFSKRPGHTTSAGRDVKATVAFAANMLALLQDASEAVTHVAIAFDNPIRSFRNDLFDAYKSDEGVPDELRSQFDDVEAAARALGITVWSMSRFEADDALATGAVRFADQVDQVRILSPDKDLGQVLRGQKIVQVDRIRKKETDEPAFRQNWGIAPASMPDLLALVGDTADGIPGLPGFGLKTAAALLSSFGSLEAVPAEAAKWPKGVRGAETLARTFRERLEDAKLYRTLATLALDAPVSESLDELRFAGTPRAAFEAFCDAYEIRDLRTRPKHWA